MSIATKRWNTSIFDKILLNVSKFEEFIKIQ